MNKTKFFALFYGTIVSVDIIHEQNVVRLVAEVAEVITNIGTEHKRKWNFPCQRPLVLFDVACRSASPELSGMLMPGSQVRITTKAADSHYKVTNVECEHQDAVPFNEFLHNSQQRK